MGAGMTATLPPAFHRVGAVGGIFMVSDETKRPDEAAMRRILDRYSDSPEGIILRLAWLEGLSRKELNELTWNQVDFLYIRNSVQILCVPFSTPRIQSRQPAGIVLLR